MDSWFYFDMVQDFLVYYHEKVIKKLTLVKINLLGLYQRNRYLTILVVYQRLKL